MRCLQQKVGFHILWCVFRTTLSYFDHNLWVCALLILAFELFPIMQLCLFSTLAAMAKKRSLHNFIITRFMPDFQLQMQVWGPYISQPRMPRCNRKWLDVLCLMSVVAALMASFALQEKQCLDFMCSVDWLWCLLCFILLCVSSDFIYLIRTSWQHKFKATWVHTLKMSIGIGWVLVSPIMGGVRTSHATGTRQLGKPRWQNNEVENSKQMCRNSKAEQNSEGSLRWGCRSWHASAKQFRQGWCMVRAWRIVERTIQIEAWRSCKEVQFNKYYGGAAPNFEWRHPVWCLLAS